jgi:hypothetical protein
MGCALQVDGRPWGLLTLDALDPATLQTRAPRSAAGLRRAWPRPRSARPNASPAGRARRRRTPARRTFSRWPRAPHAPAHGHSAALQATAKRDRAGGRQRAHRARHRRNRRGQGTGGPGASMPSARADRPWSASTARPCPTRWSKANSSATCAAPSPARWATGAASSSWPTAARCSSTRWESCRSRCRPSCCACCKAARCSAWAPTASTASTCASSPPPTATWPPRCAPAGCAPTSTTA